MTTDLDEPGDDALLLAYAGGDVGAFEQLFERHRRPLFTYLAHHAGAGAAAEDLFQEVFLRVIRHCGEYRARGNFRAWLFTIAHHAMTDGRRRAALRGAREERVTKPEHQAAEEAFASPAGQADPVARSHARDLAASIEVALGRLPKAQREVFLLRERAGLDLRAIAEVTGANLATVKSRMRYALAGLRRSLSDELSSLPEYLHE